MLRTLLVLDDYGEMVFLQTLLKKLGFDVEGIQNLRSLDDTLLSFNPDMLIATAKGKRINGIEMAEKIKKPRGTPKIVLLVPEVTLDKYPQLGLANVDGFACTPIKAPEFLRTISELAGLKTEALLEKYSKIKAGKIGPEEERDLQVVKSKTAEAKATTTVIKAESKVSPAERASRYKSFLTKHEASSPHSTFPKTKVKRYHKEIRDAEKSEETAELEFERQGFVKAMFRKGKKKTKGKAK